MKKSKYCSLLQLQDPPQRLQDRIFIKLLEVDGIATFTLEERESYEENLKYYRDIKNVVDTAREEGFNEGLKMGREMGVKIVMAKRMKTEGFTNNQIKRLTELTDEEIEKL